MKPNEGWPALDAKTKWVNLFFLSPEFPVACFIHTRLLFLMGSKCHWFLSSQSPKTCATTIGCTPHHLWSISQLHIKGLLQWKMSVGLELFIYFYAARTNGRSLSVNCKSGVGGSLCWCFFCYRSWTEFKMALIQNGRYRHRIFLYMAAAHQQVSGILLL